MYKISENWPKWHVPLVGLRAKTLIPPSSLFIKGRRNELNSGNSLKWTEFEGKERRDTTQNWLIWLCFFSFLKINLGVGLLKKIVIDVPSSMLTGQSDFDCVFVASILFTTYFRGKEFTFALILPYTSVANNMQYICQTIPVVFFLFYRLL